MESKNLFETYVRKISDFTVGIISETEGKNASYTRQVGESRG
jgi:hypothetical protein